MIFSYLKFQVIWLIIDKRNKSSKKCKKKETANSLQLCPHGLKDLKKKRNDPGDSDSDDSNSDNDSEATNANDSDAENSGENQSQTDFHQARFRELKIKISAKNIKSKPN